MGTTKEINLPVNDLETFALQYLSFIDPFNHLSDGEKDVLSKVMTSNSAFIQDDVIREKLLLDYDVKTYIMHSLDITEARLNNVISKLRKKNAIIKTVHGNKLHDAYVLLNVELPFSLVFKWEYAESQKQNG